MRVALGADAIRPMPTGIGRYAFELACGLAACPEVEKAFFYAHGHCVEDPTFFLKKGSFSRRIKWLRQLPNISFLQQLFYKAHHFLGKKKLKATPIDIYHSPNYILPQFDAPSVTTFHDFSFIHYPEFHPKERVKFMMRNLPKTIERATHFITDSEFIRQELMQLFNVPPERVTAVPLGIQTLFKPRSAIEVDEVLRKYQLNYQRYCLAVSTVEPRKNFSHLLAAFSQLPLSLQRQYPLVIVGSHGWLSQQLHKQIMRFEKQGVVRYIGYVADTELYHLYSGARGFAFPSIYEGFGLPILEAMASGAPVLTSNVSSMPEVAGDAAILINPHDVDDMAHGLEKLLSDDLFYVEARTKGFATVARYTWQACIQKTVGVYKRVLEGFAPSRSS